MHAKKRGKTSRRHQGINVTRSVVRHEYECECECVSSVLVLESNVDVFESVTILEPDTDMDTTKSSDLVEAQV